MAVETGSDNIINVEKLRFTIMKGLTLDLVLVCNGPDITRGYAPRGLYGFWE